MNSLTKIYVGVDVSKSQLDTHFYPIAKAVSYPNSEDGIRNLISQISTYSVGQIVCESSGGYEDLMIKMLRKNGYKVWPLEPNRIKSFIRSKGKKVKTDHTDAYMLALFAAQETQEHEHVEYGKNHAMIHDLVKRRKDLSDMIISEKLRLNHPSKSSCSADIQAHIDFMQQQLKEIEVKIQKLIDEDDDLKKKAEIIESMPGIGKATAALLIAEMPELGNMENKKVAALVGIAPYTQQSGQYKGKAFISGGRAAVRSGIYMAALVATRFNPAMKEFYRRLRDVEKKPAKVALVAVMRKMITILNIMVKTQTSWRCPA